MADLNSMLARTVADHGERPAIRLDGLVLSYAQLHDAAGRLTSVLKSLGVSAGDRVAVMLPNVPGLPDRVLRRSRCGGGRGADEPTAQEP